jgi:GAF domain-containing protein
MEGRGTLTGRTVLERKIIHIPDVLADPEYTSEAPRIAKFRTMLGVPLLREGVPIGVIVLTREAMRPFTDKQIELVTTFADQAVKALSRSPQTNDRRTAATGSRSRLPTPASA